MNDDIFPKYANDKRNIPVTPSDNSPTSASSPISPPTTPPFVAPQPTQPVEPRKTIPANPPAKTIFFNQNDINRAANYGSSTAGFRGGRISDLQSEVSATMGKNLMSEMPTSPTTPTQTPPAPLAPNKTYDPSIKPIRTFEGDVAEVLSHKHTSATTIAIAESKRQENSEVIKSSEPEKPSSHWVMKLFIIILILAFVGGGVFGAYYLYTRSAIAPAQQQPYAMTQTRKSLVPSDSQNIVSIDGLSSNDIQSIIKKELAKKQAPNTIREVILTQTSGDKTIQVPSGQIINTLGINAPDIIQRSLAPSWMLGIYANENSETSYFVVLNNNFFQNTFAGMLQWENIMADDIKFLIYDPSVRGIANGPTPAIGTVTAVGVTTTPATTSTQIASSTKKATSTPAIVPEQPVVPYFTIRGQFYDKIVRNKDIREFRTVDGKVLFLYSFLDNTRLLVAGNEDVVVEIMKRLEKEAFLR